MPLLWRYLLLHYFRVLILCVTGFIAVLLVTRFQDIALFASSGASLPTTILFTSYQIPHILPLALPISCLIAALLLFQQLSHSHELTAFRACGVALTAIAAPLLCAGVLLSCLNFVICSEVAPQCRILSKNLIYKVTRENPLFLLQKETIIKFKGAFVDMKVLRSGKYAEDVLFVIRDFSKGRLGLITAKELSLEGEWLIGKDVVCISSLEKTGGGGFDHLVIENQKGMQTRADRLSQFLQAEHFHTNNDYLSNRLILAKKS